MSRLSHITWTNISRLCVLATVGGLFLTWFRLHYGVDFTDEAYYAALAYRFYLGDLPFIDEWNLTQLASLLTLPLVRLYLWINGSTDGLVLYLRYCYFLFNLSIATLLWSIIRQRLPSLWAFLITAHVVLFIPFAIPSLSYNTLGCGFFLLGTFIGGHSLFFEERKILYLFSGASLSLASACYPSLALASMVFFLIQLGAGIKNIKSATFMITGALLVFLVLMAPLPWAKVLASVQYTQHSGVQQTLHKLILVTRELFLSPPFWINGTLILIVTLFRKKLSVVFLCFIPIISALSLRILPSFQSASIGWGTSLWYVTILGLTGLFLFEKDATKKFERGLFVRIWIPSLIAGITTAFSSANWTLNAGLGLLPAALITLILVSRKLRLQWSHVALIPLVSSLLIVLNTQRAFFREDSFPKLKVKIEWGPFQGIYTSKEKSAFLKTLSSDLDKMENSVGKVLFYDFFPAGYLLTSMRPATMSVFRCISGNDNEFCSKHYLRLLSPKNVVVKMIAPLETTVGQAINHYSLDHHLDETIRKNHTLVVNRKRYQIYSNPSSQEE